jgi:hypothetical protein
MEKSVILAFERALGGPDDGWQEISVQIAADILAEFSELDWRMLLEMAADRPLYWQERCVESVGMSEIAHGIPVLLTLLNSVSFQVSVIAASELENLSVRMPIETKGRLVELLSYLESYPSPRREDVQRLLDQFG